MKVCKKFCNYKKVGAGFAFIGIGASFLPINLISVSLTGLNLLTIFLLLTVLFFAGDQLAHGKF